jgi:hypothetical protein
VKKRCRSRKRSLDCLQQTRRSASANAQYEAKREMGTVPQTELRSSSLRITYCIRAGCWLLRRRGSLVAVRHRPARLRVKSRRRRRGRAPSPRKSTPGGSEGGGCMGAAREKGRNIRRWRLPRFGCAEAAMEVPVARICNIDTLHPPHRHAAVESGYVVEEAAAPPLDSRVKDSGRQGLVLPHFEDAARDGLPPGVRLSPLWLRTCQLTLESVLARFGCAPANSPYLIAPIVGKNYK